MDVPQGMQYIEKAAQHGLAEAECFDTWLCLAFASECISMIVRLLEMHRAAGALF